MKKQWKDSTSNGPLVPCDKDLFFDDERVAAVQLYGNWWEVDIDCCDTCEYPDGARFRTRRAAMLYATKHATVLWIGGRYKEC